MTRRPDDVRGPAPTEIELEADTETRQAVVRADYDDATGMREDVEVPGDISGALETVPLSSALVQHVLAKVDARAAARSVAPPPAPPRPVSVPAPRRPPPRRLGVEIAIALFAFLIVAVPALYYLYLRLG